MSLKSKFFKNFLFIGSFQLFLIGIFFSGYRTTLPVNVNDSLYQSIPIWATPISLGWKIFIDDLIILIAVLLFFLRKRDVLLLKVEKKIAITLIFILSYAIWNGIVSILSGVDVMHDIGRSLRLFLIVVILLYVGLSSIQNAKKILTVYMIGVFVGGIVNLFMSLRYPYLVNENLRLHGQNTPGVMMASIVLFALLFFIIKRNLSVWIMFFYFTMTSIVVGLSYSRTAWLIILSNLPVFLIIMIKNLRFNFSWKYGIISICFLIFLNVLLRKSEIKIRDLFRNIEQLVELKKSNSGDSDDLRGYYLVSSFQIATVNPFGVGYSGFYNANKETEIYMQGKGEFEEGLDANPHSSFLYSLTAGGFVSFFLSLSIFFLLILLFKDFLQYNFKKYEFLFLMIFALTFGIIGISVSYLFNSLIMYLPSIVCYRMKSFSYSSQYNKL